METSTIEQLKNKTAHLFEDRILKAGRVLDVRHWTDAEITEIDLHLPEAGMNLWFEVPYIKIRVAAFTYRDYTPFGWDAETRTCSLLVDTGHEGPGSQWARKLRSGDDIQYFKIDTSRQSPHPTSLIVALGDASSMAHLLALQQLTLPVSRFDGAVLLQNKEQRGLFADFFHSPLALIANEDELLDWLQRKGYCTAHTSFYLSGNHHLINRLRGQLKVAGHSNIKAKGFWS